jgi:CDP-diacylglycerol--glycerol-3-phosphate 3-phosphatidyltransferase
MADVIFHLTLFLIFLSLQLVPAWMVIVLVWREVAVSSLRLLASTDESVVIAAARPGKVKTNAQAVVCFLIMAAFLLDLPATGDIAFWGTLACVAASLYSGAFYFFGYRRILAAVYRRSRPTALRQRRQANVMLSEAKNRPRSLARDDPSSLRS